MGGEYLKRRIEKDFPNELPKNQRHSPFLVERQDILHIFIEYSFRDLVEGANKSFIVKD
jgi:hypothetical protein